MQYPESISTSNEQSISFDSNDHPLANLLKVATNTNLSVEARLLYVILVLMAWSKGRCWPSQAYQARALGRSDRAVRNYQQELEKAGLMLIDRTPGRVNYYHPAILAGTHSKTPEPDYRSTPETDCRITLKEELQNVHNVPPTHGLTTDLSLSSPNQENVNALNKFPQPDQVSSCKSPPRISKPIPPEMTKSPPTPNNTFLVEEIERVTGDTWSRGHFIKLIRQTNEQSVWSALSITREKMALESGVNGGAYFTSTLRGIAGIGTIRPRSWPSSPPPPKECRSSTLSSEPVASQTTNATLEESDLQALKTGWKLLYRKDDSHLVLSQIGRCLPQWDVEKAWNTLKAEQPDQREELLLDDFLDLAAFKLQFSPKPLSEESYG